MSRIVYDPTLYNRLELLTSSSGDEIQKRYRELALKYHPDKSPGNESKWQEILEAYTVLKDIETREIYDKYGMQGYQNSILSKAEKQNTETGSYVPLVDPEANPTEPDKRNCIIKFFHGCKRWYFACREIIKSCTSLNFAFWIFGLAISAAFAIFVYSLLKGWYKHTKSSAGINNLNQNSSNSTFPNITIMKKF